MNTYYSVVVLNFHCHGYCHCQKDDDDDKNDNDNKGKKGQINRFIRFVLRTFLLSVLVFVSVSG